MYSGTVCESPSTVMAIHSFTSQVPGCPEKWEELWVGYSLMMGRDRGGGTGVELQSHGSCLKYFTPQLSARCVMSGEHISSVVIVVMCCSTNDNQIPIEVINVE